MVSQKDRSPLDFLQSLFGGYISNFRRQGVTYYKLNLGSQKALAALKELLPYLMVKKRVAELGIEFQEQLNIWNAKYGRRGYPEEVVIGREMFYMEARRLNARSRSNPETPKYEGPAEVKRQEVKLELLN